MPDTIKSPIPAFEKWRGKEPLWKEPRKEYLHQKCGYEEADALWLEAVGPLVAALLATSKYFDTHSSDLEGSKALIQVEEALATTGLGALAPFTENDG